MLEFFPTGEKAKLDEKGNFEDFGADFLEEGGGGGGGPAGGKQVIDQEHPAAGLDGIDVNGDGIRAIFQIVALFVGLVRKFPFFPYRHEARLQTKSGGGGKNKPARID